MAVALGGRVAGKILLRTIVFSVLLGATHGISIDDSSEEITDDYYSDDYEWFGVLEGVCKTAVGSVAADISRKVSSTIEPVGCGIATKALVSTVKDKWKQTSAASKVVSAETVAGHVNKTFAPRCPKAIQGLASNMDKAISVFAGDKLCSAILKSSSGLIETNSDDDDYYQGEWFLAEAKAAWNGVKSAVSVVTSCGLDMQCICTKFMDTAATVIVDEFKIRVEEGLCNKIAENVAGLLPNTFFGKYRPVVKKVVKKECKKTIAGTVQKLGKTADNVLTKQLCKRLPR